MQTILLIDDDRSTLTALAAGLEMHGYRTVTAEDGVRGLELARHHRPELIITDVWMPGMDGYALLRKLRADPVLGATQVVLISADASVPSHRGGMDLGADDLLVKPIKMRDLMRCVEARLNRARVHWRVEDRIVKELRANLKSSLPHEFFTPLAGVLGLTQVLRDSVDDLSPDDIRDMLDEIETAGWRLHRTLDNYLTILLLEEAPPKAAPLPLSLSSDLLTTLAEGVRRVASRHHRSDDLRLEIEPCVIAAEMDMLTKILEELVENACQFSPPGTLVALRLNTDGILRITDQGRGMSEEQRRQIGAFRQFDRARHEQQGLGLGLVLVQQLVVQCGATFMIESAPGKGTTTEVAFRAPGSPAPHNAPEMA